MALDETEVPRDLPTMHTADDAIANLHLILERVRDGELDVPTARTMCRQVSVYWYLRRQDHELDRVSEQVRRAVMDLRGETEDDGHDDDEPWTLGDLEGDGRS